MYTHKKITNERFSIRFCTIANYLGFTRVGPFEKLLLQMRPHAKLAFGMGHERVALLLREVNQFKREE